MLMDFDGVCFDLCCLQWNNLPCYGVMWTSGGFSDCH